MVSTFVPCLAHSRCSVGAGSISGFYLTRLFSRLPKDGSTSSCFKKPHWPLCSLLLYPTSKYWNSSEPQPGLSYPVCTLSLCEHIHSRGFKCHGYVCNSQVSVFTSTVSDLQLHLPNHLLNSFTWTLKEWSKFNMSKEKVRIYPEASVSPVFSSQ